MPLETYRGGGMAEVIKRRVTGIGTTGLFEFAMVFSGAPCLNAVRPPDGS